MQNSEEKAKTPDGDWIDASLADLEARKAKIETLIAEILELQSHGLADMRTREVEGVRCRM